MKSLEKRMKQLETSTRILYGNLTKPENLKELYEMERNPSSEIGKSFKELYNENRLTRNPN